MRYAVIMAGGAGVRLWPLSRKSRPKQLLHLFSGTSLLRQSYERVARMLPAEQIYIITAEEHLPAVSRELPELPEANLLGEPVGRDTANAVGLSAAVLAERDPDAVIGMFTADHIITPPDRFCDAVERGFRIAEGEPGVLVTLGIRPTRPDTNYGYVHRGQRYADGSFEVRKFTEKPDLSTAQAYVSSGEYYWNSGMFAWRSGTILDQLARHLAGSHDAIRRIAAVWDTPDRPRTLNTLYPTLTKISIDFAVMEHADHVRVVELDCDWVDVGSFPALAGVVPADEDGNVSTSREVVHLRSRGTVVVSEEAHLIATLGVEDLVVVHSPDATLICHKKDASSIKELLEKVRSQYGETYS